MSNEEASQLVSKLFSDRAAVDRGIRMAHAAVVQRHVAWKLPLIVWKDGRVQSVAPQVYLDGSNPTPMPSMWVV